MIIRDKILMGISERLNKKRFQFGPIDCKPCLLT